MTSAIGSTSLLFDGTCTHHLNVSDLAGTGRSLAKTGRLDPARSGSTTSPLKAVVRRRYRPQRRLVSEKRLTLTTGPNTSRLTISSSWRAGGAEPEGVWCVENG
jgi:hypothetical protein